MADHELNEFHEFTRIMAKIPKKKRNVNAFGEELYVPEIDLPDFNTDLGFDTDEVDIDVPELELFDYDRTDNNSDVRYMRPRPSRIPTACVRYDNADALAREIKFKAGMRYDMFVSGSFIFGDFIEAFLRHNNCKAVRMTIGTLSMSKENVDSLFLLMDLGFIDNLRLMVSDYFYGHERRDIVPYIYKTLDIDNRFQMGVTRIHTKTCHFESLGGKKIVMHASANLRSSGNVEQITIEENPELYDFYEETYNILFDNFQTINHAVTSRSSWEGFEKRLTSERPKSSNS